MNQTIKEIDKQLYKTKSITIDLTALGITDRHDIRVLENYYRKLGYYVDIMTGSETVAIRVAIRENIL